jgi:hypothetical protein
MNRLGQYHFVNYVAWIEQEQEAFLAIYLSTSVFVKVLRPLSLFQQRKCQQFTTSPIGGEIIFRHRGTPHTLATNFSCLISEASPTSVATPRHASSEREGIRVRYSEQMSRKTQFVHIEGARSVPPPPPDCCVIYPRGAITIPPRLLPRKKGVIDMMRSDIHPRGFVHSARK